MASPLQQMYFQRSFEICLQSSHFWSTCIGTTQMHSLFKSMARLTSISWRLLNLNLGERNRDTNQINFNIREAGEIKNYNNKCQQDTFQRKFNCLCLPVGNIMKQVSASSELREKGHWLIDTGKWLKYKSLEKVNCSGPSLITWSPYY